VGRTRQEADKDSESETTVTTIHQLRLSISNAFLIQGDRAILVDTGSPKDGGKILAALAKHDVQENDLSLILLTHGHSDHCGSTRQLKEATSAPVAIHPSDAAAILKMGGIRRPSRHA
jgi:glyoxylase-like metal-dependent hydrolase (beta-lactamase superfamily II)